MLTLGEPGRLTMCSKGWSDSIGIWLVTKSDHEVPTGGADERQHSEVSFTPRGQRAGERADRSDRGPRREREDRPERNDCPEPEFAPAFLTRDDD